MGIICSVQFVVIVLFLNLNLSYAQSSVDKFIDVTSRKGKLFVFSTGQTEILYELNQKFILSGENVASYSSLNKLPKLNFATRISLPEVIILAAILKRTSDLSELLALASKSCLKNLAVECKNESCPQNQCELYAAIAKSPNEFIYQIDYLKTQKLCELKRINPEKLAIHLSASKKETIELLLRDKNTEVCASKLVINRLSINWVINVFKRLRTDIVLKGMTCP